MKKNNIYLDGAVPKFLRPNVYLMDIDASVAQSLNESGINVSFGSLGKVYEVNKSSALEAYHDSSELKGHEEQEIIFIDLSYSVSRFRCGEEVFSEGENGIFIKCNRGFIDSRGVTANSIKKNFDKIIASGGVVVVFASAKTCMEVFSATSRGGQIWHPEAISIDEWSFLSVLGSLKASNSEGKEIAICENRTSFGKALTARSSEMRFECTISPDFYLAKQWVTLAKNKFGETVALERAHPDGGAVIVLPQISNKADFIKQMLMEVFPERFPHLFPGIEKGRWTHLPEYELSNVRQLSESREKEVERHNLEMERIAAEIGAARQADGWLHELLTQTGDPLVEAVIKALDEIGFNSVVDMDKILDKENRSRREDLQIKDKSPTLVVDIKGIGSYPSDEDTMQASKHAALVMREEKRVDVNGLSIINHQRHLAPLQRDNNMPFRAEIVEVAKHHEYGLITTWDIYKLLMNKRRYSWDADKLTTAFYRHGRIEAVPGHYIFIGCIAKVWDHSFGVDIVGGSLNVGDTIALEYEIFFEESVVESLQVDGKNTKEANSGDKTGIPWLVSLPRPRKGMRVFVVKADG